MFTFHNALRCVFEAYRRKVIIHSAVGVWKNVTNLAHRTFDIKLPSPKLYQNVSLFNMARPHKVNSEQLKLATSIHKKKTGSESKKKHSPKKRKHKSSKKKNSLLELEGTHSRRVSTRSKKKRNHSKKKRNHSKKKSVVSQCGRTDSAASASSENDSILIVFDSKVEKETRTGFTSSHKKRKKSDTDTMGNNSGAMSSIPSSSFVQNVQGWQHNSLGWIYGSDNSAPMQQYTDSEFFVRDVFSTDVQDGGEASFMHQKLQTDSPQRKLLKAMRTWEYTDFGMSIKSTMKEPSKVFTLLSYNVLAQDLLFSHPFLYRNHQQETLGWEYRRQLLLKEIQEANADIMCLQEVQANHLNSFYNKQLFALGYHGIYKKRTGNNVDGVAIYYKKALFDMVHYTTVEYYQPDVDVLDRHNVGLIAKLAVKGSESQQQIVVATTHLLFNPRRHDVKLAQMQVLLTEVERFAFRRDRNGIPEYWPVIITGDMNFEPETGVFRFLTEGMLRYEGLCSRTLSENLNGKLLSKILLPKRLNIVDSCQHWGILCRRLIEELNHFTELKLLKIHNTDHHKLRQQLNISNEEPSYNELVESAKLEGLVNNFVPFFGPSPIPPMPTAGFATGQLIHNLNLRSVYSPEAMKATTNQGRWVTVDYIFYSCERNLQEGNLRLIGSQRLLDVDSAASMGVIPNRVSPSDHYPLLAAFYLQE